MAAQVLHAFNTNDYLLIEAGRARQEPGHTCCRQGCLPSPTAAMVVARPTRWRCRITGQQGYLLGDAGSTPLGGRVRMRRRIRAAWTLWRREGSTSRRRGAPRAAALPVHAAAARVADQPALSVELTVLAKVLVWRRWSAR
jgi:hypothetical protein